MPYAVPLWAALGVTVALAAWAATAGAGARADELRGVFDVTREVVRLPAIAGAGPAPAPPLVGAPENVADKEKAQEKGEPQAEPERERERERPRPVREAFRTTVELARDYFTCE